MGIMARVTFILGLCGSGKSTLAMDFQTGGALVFDESFIGEPSKHDQLVSTLRRGKDCVVVEIAYCEEVNRKKVVTEVSANAPGAEIKWICFQNDLDRANARCRQRPDRDPEGHVRINNYYSPRYTYPENAEVREIRG